MCRPNKEKIVAMQKAGMSDAAILDSFVKENGPGILLIEPGFWGSMSHYIGLALGLALVVWFIRRQLKKPPAPEAPELDAAQIERYRSQIERETAKLD
jgi:hypothetical protein